MCHHSAVLMKITFKIAGSWQNYAALKNETKSFRKRNKLAHIRFQCSFICPDRIWSAKAKLSDFFLQQCYLILVVSSSDTFSLSSFKHISMVFLNVATEIKNSQKKTKKHYRKKCGIIPKYKTIATRNHHEKEKENPN